MPCRVLACAIALMSGRRNGSRNSRSYGPMIASRRNRSPKRSASTGSVGKKARALQLPARTHWTEAEVARLKRLWEKTRSPSLIAERLGCSVSSVNGQIKRLDLPTIEHTKWTPARDKLLKHWCIADTQLSSQQLALQLGCTPSAANAQRRRLDLPRPKPGRRA